MDTFIIRFFVFIIFCFGSRLTFTIASAFSPDWLLCILGVIAIFPVLGWFYLIFIGKRDKGFEIFNEYIWWKDLRPLHMFLWGFFAYLAITKNHKAWVILFIDTFIGLAAFFIHHYMAGNLKKLLSRM